MTKVAVIGSSGFLGTVVVERLLDHKLDIVPFIHSSGNAWRLARLRLPLPAIDILSETDLNAKLVGCTHVINCSRGDETVMLKGLRTLLDTCLRRGVKRLIHISSVSVYGDPPHPDSTDEMAPTNPEKHSYGWIKLKQDKLVQRAAADGLPAIILCPPNISGPFSVFLNNIVASIRAKSLAILDDGKTPCNLVDVSNLAHAVELALHHGTADGRRLFITDDEVISWADILGELMPLLDASNCLPGIDRQELAALMSSNRKRPIRIGKSLLHLISSDVRSALRKDPLWERVDSVLRTFVGLMGSSVENKLRLSIDTPVAVNSPKSLRINLALSAQQLRSVIHKCNRAKQELGYRPLYTFAQSMAAFRRWYVQHNGLNTNYKDLILELG